MQYLVRTKLSKMQRKGKRLVVAHLWDGADTVCAMYSTGGIRRKDAYSVESDPGGARLCSLCVEASEGKHLDKEAREAILRDRGLGGGDLADMMKEAPEEEEVRRLRGRGELLGPLVDRFGAGAVVRALGVPHVAGSLGLLDPASIEEVPDADA